MQKKYSLLILFLVLVSLPLVNAAKSSDFVKLEVNGKEIYTHKDLVDSRYLVGSDQIFYGSSEGQITMKLYLSDKLGFGDYKIGLRTNSKNITIKSIGVNEAPSPVLAVASTSYDYPEIIQLTNALTEVIIVIEFDPNEIGILEEFYIILYDDKGNIILVYDPFLSGFSFRQELTLDTNGIGLSGNIDANLTVWVHIKPSNTEFWSNHSFSTANGINFTQSDEVTKLKFDVEDFNTDVQDANIWVKYIETFDSTTDSTMWLYYGGSDIDNSGGTTAYPSTYTSVWHMKETTGSTMFDSTSNNFDLTNTNTPTLGEVSQIGKGIKYERANSEFSSNNTLLDNGYSKLSVTMWVKKPAQWDSGATNQEQIFFKQNTGINSDEIGVSWRSDGTITFNIKNTATILDQIVSAKSVWAADTWFFFVFTFDSVDNFMAFYVDGTTTDGGTRSDPMDAIAAGTDQDFFLARSPNFTPAEDPDETIDEVKFYVNVELSSDEILLLFNSESDSLITFGSQETLFAANFTAVISPSGLDPEEGINSVTVTLTDTSTSGLTITDWNYFIDGSQFFHSTVNGNTTRNISTAGDFNFTLIITNNVNATKQKDVNVSVTILVQSVDINFALNVFPTTNADINFGVTFIGDANAFNWGFPGDQNQTVQNISKTFTSAGQKTVCVTIANSFDVNKTVCENFIVGRVIVKKPLNITNLVELTPFNMASANNPPQSFSGLSVDTNFFFFSDTSFSGTVSVDLNAEFFSTSRLFEFTSASNNFIFQPYLVPTDTTEGLEITIFTIDNQNNRTSLPNIKIESFTVVSGVSTLVESKFSDGTGIGLFHFDLDKTYTLKFFQNGELKLTLSIVPSSSNLFVFIETGTFIEPVAVGSVQIEWYSNAYFIPDINGLIALSQLLTPIATTIGDVNIIVTQNGIQIFNVVQTFNSSASDLNVAFDVNVSGLNAFKPLTVRLRIFDVNGLLIVDKTATYTFSTNVVFRDSVAGLRDGLGIFASTLIAVLLTIFVMAGIIKFRPAQDNNWLFGIGATFIGIAVFFGFISFVPGVLGIFFGSLLTIWKVRD